MTSKLKRLNPSLPRRFLQGKRFDEEKTYSQVVEMEVGG
jgi:hypothetical protein